MTGAQAFGEPGNGFDGPLPGATPTQAVVRYWRRFVVFSGRASRSEYWWAALANVVALAGLSIVAAVLSGIGAAAGDSAAAVLLRTLGGVVALLAGLYLLAAFVPGIAIGVRRLHDADLSGLFLLLALVPSVGGLIVLVLHVLPSAPRGRRFELGAEAPVAAPVPAPAPLSAPVPAPAPLSAPVLPPTAAAPVTAQLPLPVDPEPPLDTWSAVGVVERVPQTGALVAGRVPGMVRVRLADGTVLLATDGFAAREGAAALGSGAELMLPSADLAAVPLDEVARRWEHAVLVAAARRIGASGLHVPAELEQYGTLSMAVPVPGAPGAFTGERDAVGLLVGVTVDGVPESVAAPSGEVRLAGVAPLTPGELQRILDGGGAARAAIAGGLAALPPHLRFSPDRPEVIA